MLQSEMTLREAYSGSVYVASIFGTEGSGTLLPWDGYLTGGQPVIDSLLTFDYGALQISPVLQHQVELNYPLNDDQKEAIAQYVYLLYADKWERLAQTIAEEYDPLHNYDMVERESRGTERDTSTETVTPSGTTTKTEGQTGGVKTETKRNVYGYDTSAADGVPSEKEESTVEPVGDYARTTETTYDDAQTETEKTHDNTITREGLPGTYNENEDRLLTRGGNIGVTTSAQMAAGEIGLRRWIYWEEVARDIANALTIPAYGD